MKIGIIGLGFGATEFIPTLEALPEIEIVAGADLPADFDVAAGIHYLGSLIDYDLGEDKLEAMKLFFDRLYGAGLLDSPAGELSFLGG